MNLGRFLALGRYGYYLGSNSSYIGVTFFLQSQKLPPEAVDSDQFLTKIKSMTQLCIKMVLFNLIFILTITSSWKGYEARSSCGEINGATNKITLGSML
jgi:hypothetical protein